MIYVAVFSNLSFSQNNDENKSLFKLSSNPFINKSIFSTSLSFGMNYGNPSFLIQQWILPNDNKKILFKNYYGSLSAYNKYEIYVQYIEGYSLAYNYSHLGINFENNRYYFGLKWKTIKSDGYTPDASIELNSRYPISLSIGSSSESFKYYACMDFGFSLSIIPIPRRYSVGIAYSIINELNIFAEGNYQGDWDGRPANRSGRAGIDIFLYNYVHLDIALFYFGFSFNDIIPFRDGLTWENPNYIMVMPEKNEYILLSGGININFDLIR